MEKDDLDSAEKRLRNILEGYPSLAVAVSGGADSTLLAKVASEIIPDGRLILVHAKLPFSPRRESELIEQWCSENSLELQVLELDLLEEGEVQRNDSRRCYYCKKKIMSSLLGVVKEQGIEFIADGTVIDDYGDYRPGLEATDELGIQHPLAEAGFDKRLARLLARKLHISTWNMPASACLASRIPCGTPIDTETLALVDAAEDYLFNAGFAGNRVRVIATGTACIEVKSIHLPRLFRMRKKIVLELQRIGFRKVTIDLNGYTRGAMN